MREVFLTGATGTIGSALVPRLLADGSTRVRMLLRAADPADLERKTASMLAFWGYAPGDSNARRIRALHGDIVMPDLGLSPHDREEVAAACTHIIHCAASVNLRMALQQARDTAVTPTRAILALGRQCLATGVLRKIDLVSTVGVWGRSPGLMPERRLTEVASFHNTYEAAKSEAERVVWDEGEGLPITVHRPSMVVGDQITGRVVHFQVFYHLCEFLSGQRTFGVIPGLGNKALDVIPVDWVAKAIDWASGHPETAGAIFHLCSGPAGALPLEHLQQQVRAAWGRRGHRLPRLKPVSRTLLRALVPMIGAVAGAKARRALRALPPILEYLSEDQAFDNVQSARTFAEAGLPVPSVADYLAPVLDYYLAHRTQGSGS